MGCEPTPHLLTPPPLLLGHHVPYLSPRSFLPRCIPVYLTFVLDSPRRYEVNIGMFQIYNEQVDDLLVPDNNSLKVTLPR